jgi:hypothetical protein
VLARGDHHAARAANRLVQHQHSIK